MRKKIPRGWVSDFVWGLKYPTAIGTPENLVRLLKRADVDYVISKLRELDIEVEE